MYQHKFKRFLDLFFASISIFIFAPVFIILSILIRIVLGQPIIFTQQRPGLHGQPFTLYKFRTMTNKIDLDGNLLPDAERLTRFGLFLRASSLDELPELINVVKGDMSLVGPRPLLIDYLELYTPQQNRRHSVRPGITGWAQVNGRNALNWEEKFDLDVWYVDNYSLLLDIRIILMTIVSIIKRDGINQQNHVTMPKFTGPSPSSNENDTVKPT